MSEKVRSVILLSGGLDSAANLALCAAHDQPVLALTVNYGQRAFTPECKAARALCQEYGVPHQLIELPWLGAMGGSSLTSTEQEVPQLDPSVLDDTQVTQASAKSVWVPNRNGILINLAAAFAERMNAARVVVGFNREEATTFPDNSEEFLNRATTALAMSTANGVRVYCYTTQMDKRQIVAEIRKLEYPFPFGKIWSCYHGASEPCGKCESCRRLARALQN